MVFEGKMTRDPEVIMKWVVERRGWPAIGYRLGDPNSTMSLHIGFETNRADLSLTQISWEEFFRRFEQDQLVFLYRDEPESGSWSRAFTLV